MVDHEAIIYTICSEKYFCLKKLINQYFDKEINRVRSISSFEDQF